MSTTVKNTVINILTWVLVLAFFFPVFWMFLNGFKPEAVAYLQKVIERMKVEGCDAVVLGCTELPLIMNDGTCGNGPPGVRT